MVLQPFYSALVMTFCLSFGKNVCCFSSPPFSQHVSLSVCEDSSCILRSRSRGKHLPLSLCSPSSKLLLPSSNINGCWFFNEEVGVPVLHVHRGLERGDGGEGGREKRCTGAKHIPRQRSWNTSLDGWDGGGYSVNIAMPSFSLQRAKQAKCSFLPLLLHTVNRHYALW